jgi:hypothetical protein
MDDDRIATEADLDVDQTGGSISALDKTAKPEHGSAHVEHAHDHRLLVFLGLPLKGGPTVHHVNKPPSGGFVVQNGT